MKYVRINNQSNPSSVTILAGYCQAFFCQLKGLMFRKSIPENEGLLLVQNSESKVSASIHMMFMRMDLAVIWLNREYLVVDKVLARRWKMLYVPQKPARYVLEANPKHLSEFNIGDKVRFDEI